MSIWWQCISDNFIQRWRNHGCTSVCKASELEHAGIGDFQRPCHALFLNESRSSQLDKFLIVYQHTNLERDIRRIQRLEIDLIMHGECQQPTTSEPRCPGWSALSLCHTANVDSHGLCCKNYAKGTTSRMLRPTVIALEYSCSEVLQHK